MSLLCLILDNLWLLTKSTSFPSWVVHGFPAAVEMYCNGARQASEGTEFRNPFDIVPPIHQRLRHGRGDVLLQLQVVAATKEIAPLQEPGGQQGCVYRYLVIDQLGSHHHLRLGLAITALRAKIELAAVIGHIGRRVKGGRWAFARRPGIGMRWIGVEAGGAVQP